LTPAFQLCKVHLCRIKTQEIAVFCGENCYTSGSLGDILLNGRLLHNRRTNFDALYRRTLGFMPAFQRYKVRLCRIKAHEFAVFSGGCIRHQGGDI